MAGFSGAFSTSMSDASTAANQSANNQDFSDMFGDKNIGSIDLIKPSLVAAGFVGLYMFLKKKKMV